MNTIEYTDKSIIQGEAKGTKRERIFQLSLPTLVTGKNAAGDQFEERARLFSISSQQACLWLTAPVTIGTRLNLALFIQKTLILKNHLNLFISGEVSFIDASPDNNSKQRVSVELDKSYRIHSGKSS